MRIAYLTTDEVNADLAIQFAARCGLALEPVDGRGLRPQEEQGLVLDLDYLPVDRCGEVLTAARACPGIRVAVHSYNLSAAQTQQLREIGVLVGRRLTASFFRRLRSARPLFHNEPFDKTLSLG